MEKIKIIKSNKPSKNSLMLKKHLKSALCTPIPFASMLMKAKLNAIKHLAGKENLIERVWKNTAILILLMKKYPKLIESISYTQEFHQKSNWMTLLDRLTLFVESEKNTIHIQLLATLLQELISTEKDLKPFWMPVYKELSENLLLPIEIGSADSDMNLLNCSLKNVKERLPFLTMKEIKVQNRNCQKTYYQLSTSTVVNKWEREVIKSNNCLKALKVKLKPKILQKKALDEWINTSNYVFNKTVETISKGHNPCDAFGLRDKLVTFETRKTNENYKKVILQIKNLEKEYKEVEKNNFIRLEKLQNDIKNLKLQKKQIPLQENTTLKKWELKTPKDIRAGAVDDVCKAYKTGFANLKAGNIKFFKLGFRKHSTMNKSCVIPKNAIENKYGNIKIYPSVLGKDNCNFKMGKKTLKKHKNIQINNDCRIVKQKNEYFLIIPVPMKIEEKTKPINYCGVDPGVRTFLTAFGNTGCMEYEHNNSMLKKLDKTKQHIQKARYFGLRKRIVKRKLNKLENRKSYLINELHWKTINHLLKNNDVIIYGDIKSHDVVKDSKNRILNTDLNNLKLYKFKERLLFKAVEKNKNVFCINEAYTTKTCSFCGILNNPGSSKIYNCLSCNKKIGRDVNASKNILMKGIISCL